MRIVLCIAVLLFASPTLGQSARVAVPDRFVGQWTGSPSSCEPIADELTLRITPNHITYWESDGPIKAAVTYGDTEIALITELSGEGETWLATAQFRLADDGRKLIDNATIPGKELVRYKCPDPAPEDA